MKLDGTIAVVTGGASGLSVLERDIARIRPKMR